MKNISYLIVCNIHIIYHWMFHIPVSNTQVLAIAAVLHRIDLVSGKGHMVKTQV